MLNPLGVGDMLKQFWEQLHEVTRLKQTKKKKKHEQRQSLSMNFAFVVNRKMGY